MGLLHNGAGFPMFNAIFNGKPEEPHYGRWSEEVMNLEFSMKRSTPLEKGSRKDGH